MLCDICFVNRILDLERLVTTNGQTIILGIDPKCELSTIKSVSEILD